MKNLALYLHGLWAVAVAVLLYLVLADRAPAAATPASTAAADSLAAASEASEIVYVDTDTLFEKYQGAIDAKKELEQRGRSIQQNLESRQQSLQQKVRQYQQTGGGMSPQQRQNVEQGLLRDEQQLRQYQQNAGKQFQDLETQRNQELRAALDAVLAELQAQQGFRFVLTYKKTDSPVLLAPPTRNITSEVVARLNARYAEQKAASNSK